MKIFNNAIVGLLLLTPFLSGCDLFKDPYAVKGKIYNEQTKFHKYGCFEEDSRSVNGYHRDIREGMPIIARNASGEIVAKSKLGEPQSYEKGCLFEFTLSVPPGGNFYTVEMGKRGDFDYSEKELAEGETIELQIPIRY